MQLIIVLVINKTNGGKSIPMIALWCPTFSNHVWNTTYYYSDYLLFSLFRHSCRALGPRIAISSSFYVKLQAAFFLLVCTPTAQVHILLCSISINYWLSPRNDTTSLTMYTMYTCTSDTNIYIYILYKYIYSGAHEPRWRWGRSVQLLYKTLCHVENHINIACFTISRGNEEYGNI